MPYITRDKREQLDRMIDELVISLKNLDPTGDVTEGNMNYTITRLLNAVYEKTSYRNINEIIGILECAKLEYYRKRASVYEDKKIKENGDVYGNKD